MHPLYFDQNSNQLIFLYSLEVLPDALKTGCSKCNNTQKGGARKILHHLIENKKEWYKELEAIYDSEGTYKKKYTEEAKKEGLSI